MLDYLETLRAKPGHIRQKIAFGAAAGATVIVAAGWFAVAATSGTFLLAPPTLASAGSDSGLTSALAQTQSSVSSLIGAAAAFKPGAGAGSGITIETTASSTAEAPQPTVLPF